LGGRPLRVHFLTVMPSPYTQDLFAAMHADGRIAPRVFYMEMAAPDTHWGRVPLPDYAEVLPGGWFPLMGGRMHFNPGAVRRVTSGEPDLVVVAGYAGLTTQMVMRRLRRLRCLWVSGGHPPRIPLPGRCSATLRRFAVRPAVRWRAGIAAIGLAAEETYRSLAAPGCIVENIPYCCDLQPFLDVADKREGMPARDDVRFLYCGQLIERKGVDLLLDAFVHLAEHHPRTQLTLVGEGPLRASLEGRVPQALREQVNFAGFQPVSELPRYFARADAFVLPSRHDGWGVVVNQAAAAGLPLICTGRVGAARDLLVREENGYLVPPESTAALAEAMQRFAGAPQLCRAFGKRSRGLADRLTPARVVDRWYRLCRQVVQTAAAPGGGR